MATIKDFQKLLFPNQPVEWDGNWGPKCEEAFKQVINPTVVAAEPESTSTSQWPKEADAASFYGHSDGSSRWEGENLVLFDSPYDLYMDGQPVRRIRCHRLVKDSLLRILNKIRDLYPSALERATAGVDQYDGCYNYRAVRGASHLSMHAYGAAIDMDAAHNALGATHGRMPMAVVNLFKAEGWRWGGDYQNRKDFMHFEACR